jgi:preprotein translocase subunit SecF
MFHKIKNFLFPLVMSGFIIFTLFTFVSHESKRQFVLDSQPTLIVLKQNVKETELVEKLKKLTYQEVEIESIGGITYVKIKCPPSKTSFFKKIIKDLTE